MGEGHGDPMLQAARAPNQLRVVSRSFRVCAALVPVLRGREPCDHLGSLVKSLPETLLLHLDFFESRH